MLQMRQLYLEHQFLSLQECHALIQELQKASGENARIQRYGPAPRGRDQLPDDEIRSTTLIQAPENLQQEMLQRLNSRAGALQQHFKLKFSRCEKIQFLHYQSGDYFQPHRDWSDTPVYRERKLSIVLFLNGKLPPETPKPVAHRAEWPEFTGGELKLYLRHRHEDKHLALGIHPEAGLLTAFRPQLLHEVATVDSGDRFAVVTWLV